MKRDSGSPDRPSWVEVSVKASAQAALFLTPLFHSLTGKGVQILDADEGMWDLIGWVPARRWTPRARRRILHWIRLLSRHFSYPQPPSLSERMDEPPPRIPKGERRFFRAFAATDRIWVSPQGRRRPPTPPDTVLLTLDVGQARGSGLHPATRSCLRLLQQLLEKERPERALDVGTGTGILALAAAKLGVPKVTAVDSDPHSVRIARRNVRTNGLVGRVRVQRRDIAQEGGRYPLVMANLPLKSLFRRTDALLHCLAPGGNLIVGGIWRKQEAKVRAHFSPPLQVVGRDQEVWWSALLLWRPLHPGPG